MNKLLMIIAMSALASVFGAASIFAAEQSLVTESATPMVVSHLQLSGYEAHYAYRYQLIKAILDITRPEFGDYQLVPYTSVEPIVRYAQLLSEGRQLNLMWTSPGTPMASGDVVGIPVDILNGLVGYRVCLINKNSATDLSYITNVKELAGIKIGQALWSDRAVYHLNKLTEVDAPNLDSLFMMLSAKRFDCIALGADEVVRIYEAKKEQYPFLEIDNKLLIHYHYPVYLYVSKKNPLLAKRIALGFQKIQANGDFNRLFYKFHAENLARLELDKRRLICLKSPFTDESDQCVLPYLK
jgi:ABC-type amino acid transport substrate-binding protein